MNSSLDIGIAETDRQTVVDGLGRLLADSERLYAKTRTYHWNVTGPQFGPLHELFEAQYRELAEAIDAVAERMRALGAFAPGDVSGREASTRVPFDQEAVPDAEAMLGNLVRAHEAVLRTARELLPVAENARDAVTADLATARLAVHEKAAWMLRAHLT
jgi:starvation-inducible DNA-binding protein